VPWNVLCCGTFSDGTFCEWDISRAGPFVRAPYFLVSDNFKIAYLSFYTSSNLFLSQVVY
jgi:hypothetical protein